MNTEISLYYIKVFVTNIYAYYCIKKILNLSKDNLSNISAVIIVDIIISYICIYLKLYINSFLVWLFICLIQGIVITLLTKKSVGYIFIVTLISYAVCITCLGISIMIEFIVYKAMDIQNNFINLSIILTIQFFILYLILRYKRLKKGINFIQNKINSGVADSIIINISIFLIYIYCLGGTIIHDEMTKNLVVTFSILSILMVIMIRKSFTMYYKQKLLQDNLTEYKNDLAKKDQELQKIKDEKYKISKLTHEFYNRQKALELAVKEGTQNIDLINRIHNLTEEYSEELTKIKMPDKLDETGIAEIDDMFKLMRKECDENNIKFQLKVEGDIYYLINNQISENKLETLIGDHIRDAINAVNVEGVKNKEILVIIGIKDNKYELCIYDTGVSFKIETLLKLGIENTTTNKEKGGQGFGYMTTFETLNQTGASLVIEEFEPEKDNNYTKSVKFRFDGKKEYKICSYRADEIKEENKNRNRNIIIEEL